jgi:hypothetical protein
MFDYRKATLLCEELLQLSPFQLKTLRERNKLYRGWSGVLRTAPSLTMSKQKHTPLLPDKVDASTPLRLKVAAILAFPDGSMTASGLRREGARGRLALERIANKDYTTLEAIWNMRKLCRVQAKESVCTSEKRDTMGASLSDNPFGSSRTASGMSPQDALRIRLKRGPRPELSKL